MLRFSKSCNAGSIVQQTQRLKLLRQARRLYANEAARNSGSVGTKLFGFTVVTGGVVGGTVAFAYYYPDYRDKIESTIPPSKPFFDTFLAENGLLDKFKSLTGQKVVESIENIPSKLPSLPTIGDKKPKEDKAGLEKDEAIKKSIEVEDKEGKRLNQQLEARIRQCISTTEEHTKKALLAKQAAVATILEHAKVLREAVEAEKDANWSQVKKAYEDMDYAKKSAQDADKKARIETENMRRLLNEGRSGKLTGSNPILGNTNETLNSFLYQLDESEAKIRSADAESKIMSEFKELVQKGREQFAFELKSVLPNVDIHAKGDKLTEEELNSLIAHAHMRVDQLRRQLTEQQLRESQHLEQARDRQKAEDVKEMQESVDRELKKAADQFKIALDKELSKHEIHSEEELRAQLRRAAAAHSEHLEDVLRAQKESLTIEYNNQLQDSIQQERECFQREIATSMARLKGIEAALESRAAQDMENRRAKELWLACQNLLQSVVHGRKAGTNAENRRKPLANEIMTLRETTGGDAFVNTVVSTIDDEALHDGVYTEMDLRARFMKVRRLCRRTAMIGESGGNLWDYFLSLVQSLFIFDLRRAYCKDEVIDCENLDTFAIMARAHYFIWKEEDLTTAAKLLQLLHGEPRRIASDWIEDARLYLETKQAAEVLLAHAAATSMRTIY